MNSSKVRTRIAPSPTGFAHIGSAYSALINKVFTIQNNGKIVWRSEDTDRKRYVIGAEEAISDSLKWLNLEVDEDVIKGGPFAPYRQSERLDIYNEYIKILLEKGHAYHCFCTEDRLKTLREDALKNKKNPMYDRHCLNLTKQEVETKLKNNESFVIRMKIPRNDDGTGKIIVCKDLIRGDIPFNTLTIDDQVLIKSDGFPTYHMAVVVDDHLMEITHVIRGHEWLPSTPKQQILFEMFGWDLPVFAHFPSLLNMDTKGKLSKRHGHSSVNWYRSKGFLPEAIINFISLLGWSYPQEEGQIDGNSKEIFSFKELVEKFKLEQMSTSLPKFDLVKLEWMNGEYIRKLSDEKFLKEIMDWLEFNTTKHSEDISKFSDEYNLDTYLSFKNFLENLEEDKKSLFLQINKERVKKLEDLMPLNEFFFNEKLGNELIVNQMVKYRNKAEIEGHLTWVVGLLEGLDSDKSSNLSHDSRWTLENLKKVESKIKDQAAILNWKILEVFYPIRLAVTGKEISPPLFESIYILGKEKTIASLRKSILSL